VIDFVRLARKHLVPRYEAQSIAIAESLSGRCCGRYCFRVCLGFIRVNFPKSDAFDTGRLMLESPGVEVPEYSSTVLF